MKQAEISKAEKVTEQEMEALSLEKSEFSHQERADVIKATKETIKIKTLEGEIKTLKQYKVLTLKVMGLKYAINHDELFLDDDRRSSIDVVVRSLSNSHK